MPGTGIGTPEPRMPGTGIAVRRLKIKTMMVIVAFNNEKNDKLRIIRGLIWGSDFF